MKYLGSPYTHADDDVQQRRAVDAAVATARIWKETGDNVYSPIAHGRFLEQEAGLKGEPREFWMSHCREMLRGCDELIVLMLEGWDASSGLQEEIELATLWGIPISYLEP